MRVRHSRYYCPGCGQVAGPTEVRHIAVVRGSKVAPHFMSSAISAVLGEPQERSICPGGYIDRRRDEAP